MIEAIKNYDLNSSVQRLGWRFKSNDKGEVKSFKPNNNDFKALKNIVSWISREKKNNLKNNALFVKLGIYFYTDLMRKYEATVFDEIIQKEFSKLLDYPTDYFYKAFYDDLITRQFQTINIDRLEKGLSVLSKEEFEANLPFEVAGMKLNEMLSEALNRFS